ncbi:MAG: hypothetical protein AB7I30_18755 [Isosphaeraceae bacterium]
MSTFKSRRRFTPVVDRLPSRIALSGGPQSNPMDPSLEPWEPPTLPADVNPMDPLLEPLEFPPIDLGSEGGDVVEGSGGLDEPYMEPVEVTRYVDVILSDQNDA